MNRNDKTSKPSKPYRTGKGRGKGRNKDKDWKDNLQDRFADKEKAKGRREASQNVPVWVGGSENDFGWYSPNSQLAKDAYTIPTAIADGMPIQTLIHDLPEQELYNVTRKQELSPGICVINLSHTFGESHSAIDPISLATNAMFTAIRQKTSGTSYYEAPDTMLCIASLGEAISLYVWLTRVYGTTNNYDMLDRYTPKALVTAMGVDFDDIMNNLADFRTYINNYAYALSSFCVPANIDFIKRRKFVYESIYRDSNGRKAQYYMYNPDGFYQFVEASTDAGGHAVPSHLEFKTLYSRQSNAQHAPTVVSQSGLLTFAEIRTFADDLLLPLLQSQDMRYVQADFLKAFGEAAMVKINPIAETFTVTPHYSEEILMQMENAYIYPYSKFEGQLSQNPGINGYFTTEYRMVPIDYTVADYLKNGTIGNSDVPYNVCHNDNYILNFHKDTVVDADIGEATRLASFGWQGLTTDLAGVNKAFLPTDVTMEIANGAFIYYYDYNTNQPIYTTDTLAIRYVDVSSDLYFNTTAASPSSAWVNYSRIVALMSKFDWHFKFRLVNSYVLSSSWYFNVSEYIYDVDNFALVPESTLDTMNNVALLGLFFSELVGGATTT